jgi:hypothetical protein
MELAQRIESLVGQRVSLQLSNNGYASGVLQTFADDGELELVDMRIVDGKPSAEITFIRSYKDVVTVSVTGP